MIEIDPKKLKPFPIEEFFSLVAAAPPTEPEGEARMDGWWYAEIKDLRHVMPLLSEACRENRDACADAFVKTLGCTKEEGRRFAQFCAGYRR